MDEAGRGHGRTIDVTRGFGDGDGSKPSLLGVVEEFQWEGNRSVDTWSSSIAIPSRKSEAQDAERKDVWIRLARRPLIVRHKPAKLRHRRRNVRRCLTCSRLGDQRSCPFISVLERHAQLDV